MLARKRHQRRGGDYSPDANIWLGDLAARMGGLRVPVGLTDGEICSLADTCAREAMNLADGPVIYTVTEYRARLARFVSGYGIVAPGEAVTDTGAIRRMTDAQWWRRALRRYQARALEREAIALGIVHRHREIYASNATVERRAQQKRRCAAALEAAQAVNMDTGEVFTLAELAERSNASPRIRRGELMTRIAGFEGVAQGLGHAAEFVTVTVPSRFHPKKIGANQAVIDNPKFGGATPREAQQYLSKTWANCRAALWRAGLRPYGFRIAEPHHDGTPHWHMLLFVDRLLSAGRSAVGRLRAIIRRYFLRADAGEAGAKRNRCEFKAIDPARGTAAGYIAKYVSKNIDGYQVQGDLEGENLDAVTGSMRVEAWASTWGIRQFQQIGGAPVGVWRELRRMREASPEHGPTMADALAAADAGNWRRYVEVMGGPSVVRRDLPLRCAYSAAGERMAGGVATPAPLTRYGEIAPGAVYGVVEADSGRTHVSRLHRWQVRRVVGFGGSRTRVNNCSRGVDDGRGSRDFAAVVGVEIPGLASAVGHHVDACGGQIVDRGHDATELRYGGRNRGHAEGGGT